MIGLGTCYTSPRTPEVFQDRGCVPTKGYPTPEGSRQSLEVRFAGQYTIFGTSIAALWRMGGEMLYARCGYCTVPLSRCKCDLETDAAPDIFPRQTRKAPRREYV